VSEDADLALMVSIQAQFQKRFKGIWLKTADQPGTRGGKSGDQGHQFYSQIPRGDIRLFKFIPTKLPSLLGHAHALLWLSRFLGAIEGGLLELNSQISL